MNEFEYKKVSLDKIQVVLRSDEEVKSEKLKGTGLYNSNSIDHILIDGEPVAPTSRFWNSLFSRFGIGNSFFSLFSHDEVFKRISERTHDNTIKVCVDKSDPNYPKLLSAVGDSKPVIIYDDLLDILKQSSSEKIVYSKGIVKSVHVPRMNSSEFEVGGDNFVNRFEMHTPIDGYGNPNFYLSMMRLICSNGMTGFAKEFQSTLKLGTGSDDIAYTLNRAIDGFSNESGFARLRERFKSATKSWGSFREYNSLYSLLLNIQLDDNVSPEKRKSISRDLDILAGRPYEKFGIASNSFSEKRLRQLPIECKVYEMLNFATEVATHNVSEEGNRRLQAWCGSLLTSEYDLEDSCEKFGDWRSFFVRDNAQQFDDYKA